MRRPLAADHHRRDAGPERGAVGPHQPQLALELLRLAVRQAVADAVDELLVLRVDHVVDPGVQQPVLGAPEHPGQRRVHQLEDTADVGERHADRGGADRDPEHALGLGLRLPGVDLGVDIAPAAHAGDDDARRVEHGAHVRLDPARVPVLVREPDAHRP